MTKIRDIAYCIESIAPLHYQEGYDNCGLTFGDLDRDATGILVSLDINEEIIEEAISEGCNIIVAHHPIIFYPLKKLTGLTHAESYMIKAIQNNIAVYIAHTNLDNVVGGVNTFLAQALDLQNISILKHKSNTHFLLTTFIPKQYKEKLLQALHEIGAGRIGDYSRCSFSSNGLGSFLPNENATSFIRDDNNIHSVEEERLELVLQSNLEREVVDIIRSIHPYEEPVFYMQKIDFSHIGVGAVGELSESRTETEFLSYLRQRLDVKCIRHSKKNNKTIKKVAVCGGSGAALIFDAISRGADAIVTADVKYHEFFDTRNRIFIADVGHYESEIKTKELLSSILLKSIKDTKVVESKVNTNPIFYYQ